MPAQNSSYFDSLHSGYRAFLEQSQKQLNSEDCIRIDLHCHDHNSNIPDELWGRLLKLPETWLETPTLVAQLERSACDLVTITNHNNARSCWELSEANTPVLIGAEFTCHFPDVDLSVHVLCYGFTQEQERELNQLRRDAYAFVRYAKQNELPLVLPHPLFFYSRTTQPSIDLLDRFAVMFERYEVLNGQRGVWQNSLTRDWIASLTPEYIDQCAERLELDPNDFCFEPYRKRVTGGSDDHNGLFAGQCGTLIEVPNLNKRLAQGESLAELAKESLLHGRLAPYGEVGEEEKLTTTFLDYFAQVVLNMRDPGLIRLLLHKGETRDKVACLLLGNGIFELQRHNYTLKFLETFHQALQGKKPTLLVSLNTRREFKPILKLIKRIARTQRNEPDQFAATLRETIPELQWQLSKIFFDRFNSELSLFLARQKKSEKPYKQLLKNFELPIHFRGLVSKKRTSKNMSAVNLGDTLDQLTFPALAAGVVLGAGFMGTQVLYKNRAFIDQLSTKLHGERRAGRTLWLTDTLVDKNGVSTVLGETLKTIKHWGLPIDLLTCHPYLEEEPNLRVVRPISQLHVPNFDDQILYVPDILRIQKIFEQGGYDRVICSTELLMGAVALYLKHAFAVPAHFFMHTDWLSFSEERFAPSAELRDRLRRILRVFYQSFDKVITLNAEHSELLTSEQFALREDQVVRSAHWPSQVFRDAGLRAPKTEERPLRLLYVGRLSPEKGVMELPKIWDEISQLHPGVELVIIGEGVSNDSLRAALPEAQFTGWLSAEELAREYAQARALILPSRFDTFGCVILEASCMGVPTVAYNCKGPGALIKHTQNGMLAENQTEMIEAISSILDSCSFANRLSERCRADSEAWSDIHILNQLLQDLDDNGS